MIGKFFKTLYKRMTCDHYWRVIEAGLTTGDCYVCLKCGKLNDTSTYKINLDNAKLKRDNLFNAPDKVEDDLDITEDIT